MVGVSDRLAAFCTGEVATRLTPEVRVDVRRALIDFCGVALAGSTLPSAEVLRRSFPPPDGAASAAATIIGRPERGWAPVAALANGASAHSIELDDAHAESSLHPGAVVFSAALAAAEVMGASGEQFIIAVAAGYEAMVRVGLWLTPGALFARRYHPTGVCGAYGAAAATGVILGLSAEQLSEAFGIASDLSVGLMDFGESGSWSKRLHTGWPAHAGYLAAVMAFEGFRGSREIFTSPSGVLFAFTGDREPKAAAVPEPGEPLAVQQLLYKRHACCRFGHTALDILLDLRQTHRLAADDVAEIRIGLIRDGMFLGRPAELKRNPRNMVDAQFSMQYAAAVALVNGRTSLPEFRDDVISDPVVRGLMERIEVEHVPALDAVYPKAFPARVELTTRDGRRWSEERWETVGDPAQPLSEAELRSKFETLAGLAVPPHRVRAIADAVSRVETKEGPARLAASLRGGA